MIASAAINCGSHQYRNALIFKFDMNEGNPID